MSAVVAGHRQPVVKPSEKRVRFNDAVSMHQVAGRGEAQSAAFPLLTHTADEAEPGQIGHTCDRESVQLRPQYDVLAFPARADVVCPACRRNQASEAPGHNRIEGDCRFPHHVIREYACPGCRAKAGRDSGMHTHVPGECRRWLSGWNATAANSSPRRRRSTRRWWSATTSCCAGYC